MGTTAASEKIAVAVVSSTCFKRDAAGCVAAAGSTAVSVAGRAATEAMARLILSIEVAVFFNPLYL
jgi:hypothetical protein